MKVPIAIIFLMASHLLTFGQNEMESSCIKRIKEDSKDETFFTFKGKIIVSVDTIKYDSSAIVIRNSNNELFSIFTQGLIFPELIFTTSTTFHKTQIKYWSNDTLNITDIEELRLPDQDKNFKMFKFLLWRKNLANPSLYIFGLKVDNFNSENLKSFIEKARVIAFGFCSVLI